MDIPKSIYRHVSSMEPLLPDKAGGALSEISVDIFKKSSELKASLPSKTVRIGISEIVRDMNSYYSNLIEGHKTLPADIANALNKNFSDKPDELKNQQLSVAHVKTEKAMRNHLQQYPAMTAFNKDFILWLHRTFYSHIPESEWHTESKDGKQHPLHPGQLRDYEVYVGTHIPPTHEAIDSFLSRFESDYSSARIYRTNQLVALAAAHHRLAWIHPFGDGNGRVARLQSQAALIRAGVDSDGLWTISRGLARSKSDYYRQLQVADQPRQGDLDGRGNLSDKGLGQFCVYFLQQVLDQLDFMIDLVAPFNLRKRIENYIRFVRIDIEERKKEHLVKLLTALCIEGEVARGRVSELVGLKDTAARQVINFALKEALIASPSEKGGLRLSFPSKVVEYYFPNLFIDLPVDQN